MLPPLLRSAFLVSLASVMIIPLRYIYTKFCALKEDTDNKLNTTGNVLSLERVLNDAFYLTDNQIHIETPGERMYRSVFYFKRESQQPYYFHMLENGNGHVLRRDGEYMTTINFVVKVPTFLCTSIESKDEDKYGWENYQIIINLLRTYKPAGRMFSIELYDYE